MYNSDSDDPYEKRYGRIAKAALKCEGKVYTGWRHAYIRDDLVEKGFTMEQINAAFDSWNEGFVTESGRFLTRKQSLAYGMQIGQIDNSKLISPGLLTSEDLWDMNGDPLEESDD